MKTESYFPKRIPPDLKLSDKENERIEQLSPSDVSRIDNWLLSFAAHKQRKVAFLVMSAMEQLASEIPAVPDTFYILRVCKLIEEGAALN